MKITEVRIFPTESKDGKLKAFATMTFDDWFVVRNVKVIQGNNGLFVAMPSRKAMDACSKCNFKNVRGSRYCNQCGAQMGQVEIADDNAGKNSGNHMDIAHPITQECRVYIQDSILTAYKKDQDRQEQEGSSYTPASDNDLNVTADQLLMGKSAPSEERVAEVADVEDAKDIEL
ncbi:MAG: septation protein SpoVG family protein [Candidatus Omnitrophota bacterium]